MSMFTTTNLGLLYQVLPPLEIGMDFMTKLQVLPAAVDETTELVGRLDGCFLVGFANLESQHLELLASLGRIFMGTPLEQPLAESCAAIERNEFVVQHFLAIAAARSALQGALFDSLQQHVGQAMGRSTAAEGATERLAPLSCPAGAPPTPLAPSEMAVYLESARHWLMELALAGFARLDAGTLTPFMATLEQIQGSPQLIRQAALLTGFFNELMSAVPVVDAKQAPLFRWVDLWAQGIVSSLQPTQAMADEPVSGKLSLLGLDVRHHANLVSLVAYGLLEHQENQENQERRLVRITMSAYKVDAIHDNETWLLFPQAAPLFDALAQERSLRLSKMPLLPTGDLIWQGEAKLEQKYDLMKVAADYFGLKRQQTVEPCWIAPADRHPIHLAEPILLSDYAVKKQDGTLVLTWDKLALPIATERISSLSDLTDKLIAASSQLFGLLRFDAGQWRIQPLTLSTRKGRGKPKLITTAKSAAAILNKPPRSSMVGTLQERASRLLRA